MKTLIIGGTGHIGKFLVPKLIEQGCEVTVITRGETDVPNAPGWQGVKMVQATYKRQDQQWRQQVEQVAARVVIDILGSDVPSTYQAARKTCSHFIACGSVWMFGPPRTVPTPERTQGPCEFGGYTTRYEELLATKDVAGKDGIPFTAIMPPNICGPGKIPIEGAGGRDLEVHKAHMQGKPITLPDGCNTLIGPCDASDVAQGFARAVADRDAAAGEIFNVGSAYSLTAPQLVDTYAKIYETTIPIEYVAWGDFTGRVMPEQGANYHFREHMCPDISKARSALGYQPEFTPEQTMARAVGWMRQEKLI